MLTSVHVVTFPEIPTHVFIPDCSLLVLVHDNCTARPGTKHEGRILWGLRETVALLRNRRAQANPIVLFIGRVSGHQDQMLIRIAVGAFCSGGRITVHTREAP
jgi:hypothetical protein